MNRPERITDSEHEALLGDPVFAFEGSAEFDTARPLIEDAPLATPLNDESRERMGQALKAARGASPEAYQQLTGLYQRIIALDQQAGEGEARIMRESKLGKVPFSVLRKTYGAFVLEHEDMSAKERKESFWNGVAEREGENGWEQLSEFVEAARKPYNLFSLDKEHSVLEVEERYAILNQLYEMFNAAPLSERDALEQSITEMFGIPQMPPELETYLARLDDGDSVIRAAGAENKNSIFFDKGQPDVRVLKLTKGRHDVDFTSLIKLMRDMHGVASELNVDLPDAGVRIQTAFNDMTVFRDGEGHYKRLVRQDFAPGTSMNELPIAVKDTPEFQEAWRTFLGRVEEMRESHGVILDISDSSAGMRPERGNIANTGNVFIRFPDETDKEYLFTIIDPDVFDTAPGEHKFDPKEYLRNESFPKGVLDCLKVLATNVARESVVRPWQDAFTQKALAPKDLRD